jgi:hypothetical protein
MGKAPARLAGLVFHLAQKLKPGAVRVTESRVAFAPLACEDDKLKFIRQPLAQLGGVLFALALAVGRQIQS